MRGHTCTLDPLEEKTNVYLQPLPPNASVCARFRRWLREITVVSGDHTSCSLYFRSTAAINFERKRHVHSHYWFIIHPFSDFRSYWEQYMCLVFFISLISVPLDVGFNKLTFLDRRNPFRLQAIITTLLDLACLLDILLTCFTGLEHYDTKRIILHPWTIMKRYLTTYFIFDMLASVPVDLVLLALRFFYAEHQLYWTEFTMELFELCRIFRLKTMVRYLDRVADSLSLDDTRYRVMRLMTVFLLIVHWIGCIMYIIPRTVNTIAGRERHNWVYNATQDEGLGFDNKHIMYLLSFMRSMSHLVGAGHTTYVTVTIEDIIVGPIVIIFGTFYVTYIFVTGIQIILSRRASRIKYLEIMNQLQEYMRHKQLPIKMQQRLNAYYEYRFQQKYFRENAITDTISSRLRQEITLYSCRRLVENVDIFEDLPRIILGSIVESLRPEVFLPNDILIKAGSAGDCMYFLANGTVAVYTANGKEVCHLEDGAYFGEIALLMPDQKRVATVIAIEICDVFRLDRRNFRRCFSTHTKLYEDIEKNALLRMEKTLIAEEKQRMQILERVHMPWKAK